ncbi:hypothetical protein GCM10018793_69670 [Streptomyces sulfonofaciens]|uniref:Uncharacterized protein n=1 Tax=Streptomyces sulfonofaciens TaxID=68272 RepID=A0A919GR70_9ACTN|nr:hypothetical protein GCM10018793_69670 [Streptomyces sulfonofaciens]
MSCSHPRPHCFGAGRSGHTGHRAARAGAFAACLGGGAADARRAEPAKACRGGRRGHAVAGRPLRPFPAGSARRERAQGVGT